MSRKPHKAIKVGICIVAALGVLVFINFIPTFYLKNPGMNELQGEYITVFYKHEAAAKDVFGLVEAQSERIATKLGFMSPQDVRLYIYDNQSAMQMKKYGLTVMLLNLDWYIGDNRGTNVILTSPANPDAHNAK